MASKVGRPRGSAPPSRSPKRRTSKRRRSDTPAERRSNIQPEPHDAVQVADDQDEHDDERESRADFARLRVAHVLKRVECARGDEYDAEQRRPSLTDIPTVKPDA